MIGDLSLQLQLASRWRDADSWFFDVSGSLGWRSFFLRAGYQAPATWDLEGRLVEVWTIPLAAGWRPTLWRRGRWRLQGLVAVVVERLSLRREKMVEAVSHHCWDVGMALGLDLGIYLTRWLVVGASVEGTWFPSGGEILISEGPSARFNRLGVQPGLSLTFARDR